MKLHALVADLDTARVAVDGGATVVQWRLKDVPTLELGEEPALAEVRELHRSHPRARRHRARRE